jgi:hypothetical protein
MKLSKGALFSLGEENTFRVLDEYFRDFPFLIYKEVALNRVIEASREELSAREWDYYTRASLDFVICAADPPHTWELAIEFDSSFHDTPEGQVKDDLKNLLCDRAGLPLLRIRSDHVLKREGVSFLKYMLDLYFGEKAVQELVERGQLDPDEEYFPSTEFEGTTKLRRKLEDRGIIPPSLVLMTPVCDRDKQLWYRIGVGMTDRVSVPRPGWSVASAKVEILRGWNRPPEVLLAVERTAYLKDCSPRHNILGVHGWHIARQFAQLLCFQEIVYRVNQRSKAKP